MSEDLQTGGIGAALGVVVAAFGKRAISAVFGGPSKLRREMMDEVWKLREHVDKIEAESVTWRERYFKQWEENVELRARCVRLEQQVAELIACVKPPHS